jgi:hypothetical protein
MSIDLDDPIALMLVAAAALERSGAECAAYRGLVLGMYGEPRETRDADFAVMGVDVERARLALAELGVDVVVAFSKVRFGGCDVSRLSPVGGSQVNTVDLVTPVRHGLRETSSAGRLPVRCVIARFARLHLKTS